MPPQSTAELLTPASDTVRASLPPAAAGSSGAPLGVAHPPSVPAAEPWRSRYPALFPQVVAALTDPDGFDAGLRKLDDRLRRRGPTQFARFYIEELLGRSPENAAEAKELVLWPSRHIVETLCSNEFLG